MKQYASIFNDVLSPITPGPSSSNTCGPCRISYIARQIFGEQPQKLLVEMCDRGGYKDTFYGMQSDLAFIAGMLEKDPLHYDLSRAYEDAKSVGMEVEYRFVPHLPALPSELAALTLFSKNPNTLPMRLTAASLGGGTIQISEIDDCKTDIGGDSHQLLIFLDLQAGSHHLSKVPQATNPHDLPILIRKLEVLIPCINEISFSISNTNSISHSHSKPDIKSIPHANSDTDLIFNEKMVAENDLPTNKALIQIQCWAAPTPTVLDQVEKLLASYATAASATVPITSTSTSTTSAAPCNRPSIRYAAPVHPIVYNKKNQPLFTTVPEMLSYIQESHLPLWQAAVHYEMSLSGWSDDQVLSYAEKLWDIACTSIQQGLAGGFSFKGITNPHAAKLHQAFSQKSLIPMGIGTLGAPAALGIMEYSNAHGTIVCMPTGGSSGIVPGAIYATAAEMQLSRQDCVHALLVAGLIGSFMFETNYSGAIGCQAEIGCAVAMAAAALCTILSEDANAACDAASLGIQNTLGLICDPIAGYVQVPCFIRNMAAVPTAAVCANAAACGFPATVPLEEMIRSIVRVGEKMRPCNALGTCATKTGCRLTEEMNPQR